MPSHSTTENSSVRLTDFAQQRRLDPWHLLDKFVEAGAEMSTSLPEGRYFTHYTRTAFDPFEGRDVETTDPEVCLDLVGSAGLMASDVAEMARARSAVAVVRVKARWGEVVTIDEGGPVLVTIDALFTTMGVQPRMAVTPTPMENAPPEGTPTTSTRCAEWVSTRAAARSLTTRNEALYALVERGLNEGVCREVGGGGQRRHVRWDAARLPAWFAATESEATTA